MSNSQSRNAALRQIVVHVPATTANLGPGFDCLGLALELRNKIVFETEAEPIDQSAHPETKYTLHVEGIDAGKIPRDKNNLLIKAAEMVFDLVGRRPATLSIHMENNIPVGSGLGSSSSAIVAGLFGGNALVNGSLSEETLTSMAIEMEGHPDNVAPAVLGGLVLGILPDGKYGPPDTLLKRMNPPPLTAVIVLPDFHFLTSDARSALPDEVTRQQTTFNTSRFGLLIHSFLTGDYQNLKVAMADQLHQPYRLALIPGAADALAAAYDAGANGVALSGAGPSLVAFSESNHKKIALAMATAFATVGLKSRYWVLKTTNEGTTCIEADSHSQKNNALTTNQ